MVDFFSPANLKSLWVTLSTGHAFAATGIVIALLLTIRAIILRIANRSIQDSFMRMRYRRGVSYAMFFVGIFLLLPIWLPSIRNIATFLGIFGAGFLIVTKDLWICVGGWAYIMIRRPYAIGDRVEVGEIAGDVIDIRLMETSIMEVSNTEGRLTTGRIIYFPNAKVFTEIIATTSKEIAHTYQEMHVRLGPASDWQAVEKILIKATYEEYKFAVEEKNKLENHEVRYTVSGYREPRVLTEMQDGHIVLHLQFMAPHGLGTIMTDRIWRSFLSQVQKDPTIQFGS
ncbi:MAG TPA: mechanosensitive ion channel family protein [Turneriella sp.]|nr:mechanosensitive ion channel family protein [Turneriella sp.]